VNRVVGPGTADEFLSPSNPRQVGALAQPQLFVANGVVSATARVQVSATVLIDSTFYDLHHLVPGNGPNDVDVSVNFTMNGQPVGNTERISIPNITNNQPITVTRARCLTIPSSMLRFARLPDPDNPGGPTCVPLGGGSQPEYNCPGINEVEARVSISVRQRLFDLGSIPVGAYTTLPVYFFGGLPYLAFDLTDPQQGINVIAQASQLSFEAMAPTVLVTGCCGEKDDFWYNPRVFSTMGDRFKTRKIPFTTRRLETANGMLRGSIEEGARELSCQVVSAARQFGVQWVHLVAHSKGGLNSRQLLDTWGTGTRCGPWMLSQNIGVLSLTTLDTPHEGSVGGTIVGHMAATARASNLFQLGGAVVRGIMFDRKANEDQLHSMSDLSVAKVMEFDLDHLSPPTSLTIRGVTKSVRRAALVSDANFDPAPGGTDLTDGNGNVTRFYERQITVAESGGFAPEKSIFIENLALQAIYNAMGTTTDATYTDITGQFGGRAYRIINPVPNQRQFLLNDGVVTVSSQGYSSVPSAFPLLFPTTQGLNHSTVANATVADKIIDTVLMRAGRQ
jgi:hypothetical protein